MKIVIDTNILLSALIKDAITRHLIVSLDVLLYYPEESFDEIIRNKKEVLEKGKISEEEFTNTFTTLFKYVRVVKNEEIRPYAKEADRIIGNIHKNDVVFIAVALAKGAIIWSNDNHFQKQNKIFVITTKDIITNFKKLL